MKQIRDIIFEARKDVFERRTSIGSGLFSILGSSFAKISRKLSLQE